MLEKLQEDFAEKINRLQSNNIKHTIQLFSSNKLQTKGNGGMLTKYQRE